MNDPAPCRLFIRIALGLLGLPGWGCGLAQDARAGEPRFPRLDPDYAEVTFPPNIAAPNFRIVETGRAFRVRLGSVQGPGIELEARGRDVTIPPGPWRRLLEANAGQPLRFDVSAQEESGRWTRFATVTNRIAREPIDGCLVYRWLHPIYSRYTTLEIRQRNLTSYEVRPLLRNGAFDRGCLNCHSFVQHRPDPMALHIRSQAYGRPMLVARGGQVTCLDRTAGYLAWHPGGRLIAFSANKLSLFYHTVGEPRDVFDADSDVRILDLEHDTVISPPPTTQPDELENWPEWSPDGGHLYFCRAPKLTLKQYKEVRYDLARAAFDSARQTWGPVETLVSAAETHRSSGQPKVSPDGRYLLFCLFDHGHFPVYQKDSDLYLMDLTTRQYRRLEIDSEQTESWHGWSSNGRWIVFSSKRRNGTFAHPHFSYFDAQGVAHKPFILPQRDPGFYDTCIHTFNVPELVSGPVTVPERSWVQALERASHRRRAASAQLQPKPGPAPEVPPHPVPPPPAHNEEQYSQQ